MTMPAIQQASATSGTPQQPPDTARDERAHGHDQQCRPHRTSPPSAPAIPFGQRAQEEREVGRAFGQPHEIAVPLGAQRQVDTHPVAGVGEPAQLGVADAIQHLILEVSDTA